MQPWNQGGTIGKGTHLKCQTQKGEAHCQILYPFPSSQAYIRLYVYLEIPEKYFISLNLCSKTLRYYIAWFEAKKYVRKWGKSKVLRDLAHIWVIWYDMSYVRFLQSSMYFKSLNRWLHKICMTQVCIKNVNEQFTTKAWIIVLKCVFRTLLVREERAKWLLCSEPKEFAMQNLMEGIQMKTDW